MFMSARNQAGLSREEAADRLFIGNRTLNNYEHGLTTVPPETALRMQDVYLDPTLTAKYCSDYCPIGQIFAHSVPDHNNLCQAVMGLLKEQNDFAKVRENLIDMASDGIIDQSELPEFEAIMEELLDLEKRIEEIKLAAAAIVSIPNLMQKRKSRLAAAR